MLADAKCWSLEKNKWRAYTLQYHTKWAWNIYLWPYIYVLAVPGPPLHTSLCVLPNHKLPACVAVNKKKEVQLISQLEEPIKFWSKKVQIQPPTRPELDNTKLNGLFFDIFWAVLSSEECFFCLLPLTGELKRARQCLLTDEMKSWLIDFNEYEKRRRLSAIQQHVAVNLKNQFMNKNKIKVFTRLCSRDEVQSRCFDYHI